MRHEGWLTILSGLRTPGPSSCGRIHNFVYSFPDMKPLFWAGSSLQDLRAFPEDAKRIAGHELHLVQEGLEPDDWKAIVGVGSGVYELRIRTAVEHRVFYVAKFAEVSTFCMPFRRRRDRLRNETLSLPRSDIGRF
jgi:phage-related protein